MVITIIETTLAVLLCFTAAALGYYWTLAWVARLRGHGTQSGKRRMDTTTDDPHYRFAILVPAHNEEETLHLSVCSCLASRYPRQCFTLIVVADNCDDNTCARGRRMGVQVVERSDHLKRGKGHAVAWALAHIELCHYDAVLVLDADCVLPPDALGVFNDMLTGGCRVIQTNLRASNPDVNAITFALAVGNHMENDLFYAPKHSCGLAVFLHGTGMVFAAEVLQEVPWDAFSVTEDLEYSLRLMRKGVAIDFASGVWIDTDVPLTRDQVAVQRGRWACGAYRLGKKHTIKLITEGLRTRNRVLIDAGWTLLIRSKPLLVTLITMQMALCALCYSLVSTGVLLVELWCAVILFSAMVAYMLLGIVSLGLSVHRLLLVFKAPFVTFRLIIHTVLGMRWHANPPWERTPRRP